MAAEADSVTVALGAKTPSCALPLAVPVSAVPVALSGPVTVGVTVFWVSCTACVMMLGLLDSA